MAPASNFGFGMQILLVHSLYDSFYTYNRNFNLWASFWYRETFRNAEFIKYVVKLGSGTLASLLSQPLKNPWVFQPAPRKFDDVLCKIYVIKIHLNSTFPYPTTPNVKFKHTDKCIFSYILRGQWVVSPNVPHKKVLLHKLTIF